MLYLLKIWTYIKHYWYVPLAATVIILLTIISKKKVKSVALSNLLVNANNYKDAEIHRLEQNHKEEAAKKEQVEIKYLDIVQRTEKVFVERQETLKVSEKKQLKKIVEEFHGDQDGLAKQIAEKYGFEYVP